MRKKTLQRFEDWRKDAAVPAMLCGRVAEGESLKEVCASLDIPYSLVARWIAETPVLKAQYEAALQLYADSIAHEALSIADEQSEVVKKDGSTFDPDVSRDKLRVDTRLRLAGKWDRQRYGEQAPSAVSVQINLGDVAKEIAALEERLGVRGPGAGAVLSAQAVEVSDAEVIE